jgi:ATP-dependent helicase HrpA
VARGAGDILVFLPGEREIREAADHLRKHLASQRTGGPQAEILPLFARLSQAEQDRVFNAGNGRRIVLATNVAETSLTVPGIRYVIDSRPGAGQALQLPQQGRAAAGRADQPGCGQPARRPLRPRGRRRLHPPVRREELRRRPRFTDPEILRSSRWPA